MKSLVILLALTSSALALPPCGHGLRNNCIVDGDTLWLDHEKVRISGIDAPELFSPKCASERALAMRSAERLGELTQQNAVTLQRHGKDRYNRTLGDVSVDGTDVGRALMNEGLAREWRGHREPWC